MNRLGRRTIRLALIPFEVLLWLGRPLRVRYASGDLLASALARDGCPLGATLVRRSERSYRAGIAVLVVALCIFLAGVVTILGRKAMGPVVVGGYLEIALVMVLTYFSFQPTVVLHADGLLVHWPFENEAQLVPWDKVVGWERSAFGRVKQYLVELPVRGTSAMFPLIFGPRERP